MSETCRACEHPLIWAKTPAGRAAPIEENLSPDGNVMLVKPAGLGVIMAVTLSGELLDFARRRLVPLHLNHFAACAQRELFKTQTKETVSS